MKIKKNEEEKETFQTPKHGRRLTDATTEERPYLWLLTFTDVMGLMLTFFVLLFSMVEPEQEKFDEIASALNNEFNTFYGSLMSAGPEDSINIERINYDRALDINYLDALIKAVAENNTSLKDKLTLNPQGDHLIVSLPQDLLFEPGSASLRAESNRALYALGGTFSRIKNKIELTGHADPRPVELGELGAFVSNWDLSLTRAMAVAAVLDKVGYNEPVIVRGAANGRYIDLKGMDDENRRLDLSRRVDIDIMNHDGRRARVFSDPVLP